MAPPANANCYRVVVRIRGRTVAPIFVGLDKHDVKVRAEGMIWKSATRGIEIAYGEVLNVEYLHPAWTHKPAAGWWIGKGLRG